MRIEHTCIFQVGFFNLDGGTVSNIKNDKTIDILINAINFRTNSDFLSLFDSLSTCLNLINVFQGRQALYLDLGDVLFNTLC